jgi:enamine deaminase RidA (YjgF/YER057c/UK114 family)
MTLEHINPEDLPTPPTYSHVVVATNGRLVFVTGQEPEDEQGNLVGPGDLAAQARQVFAIRRPGPCRGPTRWPGSRSTSSATGAEQLPVIERAGWRCSAITCRPTHWSGCRHSHPDYLIEVEAIAVIDD